MIGRFVKKPIVIEAQQLTDESFWDVYSWIREGGGRLADLCWDDDGRYIEIETLEGRIKADYGDWVIRGIAGEFYSCKPDIFAATYEAKQ